MTRFNIILLFKLIICKTLVLSLLTPSQDDYQKSSQLIIDWIWAISDKVDWCIYGSFVTWKVRPWLSDIDVFLLLDSNDIIFPWSISQEFSKIKLQVEQLWIPLQSTYTTTWALQSRFAALDYFYLQEVKRGMEAWTSSRDFSDVFIERRKWSIDDLLMARYFLKKISNLPSNFYKISEIILKPEPELNLEDQRELQKFWDAFKKMLSFCTLAVRILKWDSIFDKIDIEILSIFNEEVWDISKMNDFLSILWRIKSIEDWYIFLKQENGLDEIMKMYDTVFLEISQKVSKRFSELY